MSDLSQLDARRISLHAMGFTEPRPGKVDIRHVRKTLQRLRAIQIDSVNVLVRAHYMPLFSRLGPYRMELLDELAYKRKEAFEYWGHVASFVPVEFIPMLRFRMEAERSWLGDLLKKHPTYIDDLIAEVKRRGPMTVSDLEDPGNRTGPWWGWAPGKTALEYLFVKGVLGVQERRNFARVYDLFE
ncbi:MAG: winged helix DNA-binding domain-containing protein, partial [Acidimicrobiia bacterium]|nr:winged helix DNA-binding domain-containing protein [Acidimicrobiia bacterium]